MIGASAFPPALRALVALLLLASCTVLRPAKGVPTGKLPGNVTPLRYGLDLEIDPREPRFRGDATIDVELARATREIWLHAERLVPSNVAVLWENQIVPATWHPESDGIAAVRTAQEVGPGRAALRIRYTAPFDEHLRGLYRVEVGDEAYAFTQFEPLDARRAFPSFDEPRFKTPFDVTLTTASADVAIANTPPAESVRLEDGRVRTRFAPTVPLPTYLVAFGVGPFDRTPVTNIPAGARDRPPLPLRGAAVAGRAGRLRYVMERTPALLVAFEDWFEEPFPYRKLDILAVPDFASGAMENAGAITFRDTLLLFDEDAISAQRRRAFTYVMAHELAHTWFGNSVTMPWWDDLWLNEAFATWHGNRIVSIVAPEQQPAIGRLRGAHTAMAIDGRASARAIRQPIESDHDVHNAFDPITYSKGAAVLSMFEQWVSPEVFRTGVRAHIAAHRDDTATTDDLLSALAAASDRDVATPFETFLDQPGVPLVTATLECDANGNRVALAQRRHLPLGSEADPDLEWQIPVCVRFPAGAHTRVACHLLDTPEGSVSLPGGSCPSWLLPNANAAGYYRFRQPPTDLGALMRDGFPTLSPAERLSVANNLDAGFRAGAPVAPVFVAFETLASDPSRGAATTPIGLLATARDVLVEERDRPTLEAFTDELYRPRFDALGWDAPPGEDGETALLRRAVLEALLFIARSPDLRSEAARRGRRYAGIDGSPPDRRAVAPDLVVPALRVAVEEGDAADFEALVAKLHESRDGTLRRHLLAALGAAPQPELAARAQAIALDPRLRVNEVTQSLHALLQRPETQAKTWSFVEENFDLLVTRVGAAQAGNLPWLASPLCTDEDAGRVEAFLEERMELYPGGPRNLAGALESIRECAALRRVQREPLHEFLDDWKRR